ncbi:hypothetical protein BdWA1_002196 [Babesia duncani]|uniref:Uncharacterized protein n=1 Tax=Babesia duncani TaxID=323732 RepID=A0AAD9PHJ7_9APIC|nr:hypothetical protein BdWA1_003643 [Babesia duncani]KAK2196945.1 hypothetical protein BdWA1_002194 [Babesia duncani]KAK2196946.1 hypothetical protein BdWA1_002195 [Babesia duncani]KAK2196947.1 hypothetical protein BdWA1_002196 [Babesia duncani]
MTMDFTWFITFTVAAFNLFKCASAAPFNSPEKVFEFFDEVARIQHDPKDCNACTSINMLFNRMREIWYFDFCIQNATFDLLDNNNLVPYCKDTIEYIREYKGKHFDYTQKHEKLFHDIQDKIVGGLWDDFAGSGEKRGKQLELFRETEKEDIKPLLECVHQCILSLTSLESRKLFQEPLKQSIKYIVGNMSRIKDTLNRLTLLKIKNKHPNLVTLAQDLVQDYIKALNQYKETFTKEHEKMLNMIKAQENALRGNS